MPWYGGHSKASISRTDKHMGDNNQSDTIFLRDLRVDTVVGIWQWERKIRQTVSIDLEMGVDIPKAAATDRIEDTLNYKDVAKRVQQSVTESEFQLVETMAEKIAELVLADFDVPWIDVRINKPGAIRNAADVGVQIHRSR